jgi:uncharacterized RDD family membrane protein YckC
MILVMSHESPENPSGFASPSDPQPEQPPPYPHPYGQPYGAPGRAQSPGPAPQGPGPGPQTGPGPYGGQPYPQQYPPGQPYGYGPLAPDPTLAEWWQRLVARIVDSLIIALITSPLVIWFMVWYVHQLTALIQANPDAPPNTPEFMRLELKVMGFAVLLGLTQGLLSFLYDWFQHAKWGQTLGKRVMKIKVVALADRGPVTGGSAAKRAAAYGLAPQVPLIGGAFSLINSLWLLWDKPNRQCLHDKFAGTVVIKTEPGPRP